jgi:hypothetical protein
MQQTDSELLEAFKRMHPTYTAKTLQSVLGVSRTQAFRLLREGTMRPPERKLVVLYLRYPELFES